MQTSPLHLHERGDPGRPPLILLHGLLGDGGNWGRIAGVLAGRRRVIAPDLPNHGRSPHRGAAGPRAMATEIGAVVAAAAAAGGPVELVGHSLGGRLAMLVALAQPADVGGLVVADMPTGPSPAGHGELLRALAALDPAALASRAEADRALSAAVPAPAVRRFLLKNLLRRPGGEGFAWRCDLAGLIEAYGELTAGLAELGVAGSYPGPVLLLRGGGSDYVPDDEPERARAWFPRARLATIPDAGHWLHWTAPEAFLEHLRSFFGME